MSLGAEATSRSWKARGALLKDAQSCPYLEFLYPNETVYMFLTPLEMEDNKFVLFLDTKFAMKYHSNNRKLIWTPSPCQAVCQWLGWEWRTSQRCGFWPHGSLSLLVAELFSYGCKGKLNARQLFYDFCLASVPQATATARVLYACHPTWNRMWTTCLSV